MFTLLLALLLAIAASVNAAGECGQGWGRCSGAMCCSRYNYCGTSAAYCGTGCQAAWGRCSSTPTPTPSRSPTPTPRPSPSPSPRPSPSSWTPSGLTGYNIMSSDNTSPGALAEHQVSQRFVDNVNVVAVHQNHWAAYKYAVLEISYGGQTGLFQVWDYCADKDCGGCCTHNMQGTGFLLDIDAAGAKRAFNYDRAEDSLYARASFRRVGSVDPNAICRQFGCS